MNPKEMVNEELKEILSGISELIESVDISKVRQIPQHVAVVVCPHLH